LMLAMTMLAALFLREESSSSVSSVWKSFEKVDSPLDVDSSACKDIQYCNLLQNIELSILFLN
jgi:hypothetical protein